MSKRYAEDAAGGGGSGNGGPPRKKVVMEPLTIGPISNLEELEMKTLQFQNQKLGMRLNQRIQVCTLYTVLEILFQMIVMISKLKSNFLA